MSRHQTRIEAARLLVTRLNTEGRPTDARVVNDLARSSAVSLAHNRSLHRDLGETTKRLAVAMAEAGAAKRALARAREMDNG